MHVLMYQHPPPVVDARAVRIPLLMSVSARSPQCDLVNAFVPSLNELAVSDAATTNCNRDGDSDQDLRGVLFADGDSVQDLREVLPADRDSDQRDDISCLKQINSIIEICNSMVTIFIMYVCSCQLQTKVQSSPSVLRVEARCNGPGVEQVLKDSLKERTYAESDAADLVLVLARVYC
jgi:hypothetical protein